MIVGIISTLILYFLHNFDNYYIPFVSNWGRLGHCPSRNLSFFIRFSTFFDDLCVRTHRVKDPPPPCTQLHAFWRHPPSPRLRAHFMYGPLKESWKQSLVRIGKSDHFVQGSQYLSSLVLPAEMQSTFPNNNFMIREEPVLLLRIWAMPWEELNWWL